MDVHVLFTVSGFSNCYVLGQNTGGGALVIDPGLMDVQLLRTIEDNRYSVRGVLVTHDHDSHVAGIRTLKKVYDVEIFANADEVAGFPATRVFDDRSIVLDGIDVLPIAVAGHSADSVVYRIDSMLFTGDVLSAGRVGTTPNAFARALLIDAIRERICALEGDYFIFPGHGAPSTLESERKVNPAFA